MKSGSAARANAHDALQRLYERRIQVHMAIESLEQLRLLRERRSRAPVSAWPAGNTLATAGFSGLSITGQHLQHLERVEELVS
jgi:hypothetical protein